MLGAVSKSSINLKESQMKLFLNTSQIQPKTSLQTLLQNIFLKLSEFSKMQHTDCNPGYF